MNSAIIQRLEVIAVAIGSAVGLYGLMVLLGVGFDLKDDAAMDKVGFIDVILASTLAGFAAWGVHSIVLRLGKARFWPFVATTILAISMSGPGYMADGGTAVALMALHFAVAIPLILGFARPASRHSGQGSSHRHYRASEAHQR